MSSMGVRLGRGPPLASIESLLGDGRAGRSALLQTNQDDDMSDDDEFPVEEEDDHDGDGTGRKQAEEMYKLLSPLAQIDFEHEVTRLRGRVKEVLDRLGCLERSEERGEVLERLGQPEELALAQLDKKEGSELGKPLKREGSGLGLPAKREGSGLGLPVQREGPELVQLDRREGPQLVEKEQPFIPGEQESETNQRVQQSKQKPPLQDMFSPQSGSSGEPILAIHNTIPTGLPGLPNLGGLSTEEEPPAELIRRYRQLRPKVTLNVGGVRHEVMWRMLEKQPRSRLGRLGSCVSHPAILDLCDAYSLQDNEYFFDRHPRTFNCILNFYRTGRLHMMDEMCVLDFSEDLQYWMIDEIYLEGCCENKFNTRKEFIQEEIKKDEAAEETEIQENFGTGKFAKYQKILWDTFEKPHKSKVAKFISLLSISLVLLSTLGMSLNTMPYFRHHDASGDPIDNPKLALIEAICISWFTVEYLLRLAGAPQKWDFVKGTMNVIDVLAILPYYISLFFLDEPNMEPVTQSTAVLDPLGTTPVPEEAHEESPFGDVSRIIQVFRIARIMRIFKLARRSVGLQAIAHTMKNSYKELGLLLMFVGMGMLIFGSLAYFAEKDEKETSFDSIPQGMWWAIQTLTSVGYGDLSPQTMFGKLVGMGCAVSGVLVMALPIPIVVENFAAFYEEQKKREVIQLKKEAAAAQKVHDDKALLVEVAGLVKTLHTKPGPFTKEPKSPPTFTRNGVYENSIRSPPFSP